MHPYVAGWIASDGHNAGRYWVISQNVDDIEVLRRIQKTYRDSCLRIEKRRSGYGKKDMAILKRISYNDCLELEKKWGIPVGKKSYRLRFPKQGHTWLYLRGMFEGDGSVSSEGGKYPRVQIISNRKWCDDCKKFLGVKGIDSYVSDDKRHPGLSNLIVRKTNHVHRFMSYLYRGQPKMRMERKFSKWIKIAKANPILKRERRFLSGQERKELERLLLEGNAVGTLSTRYGINKNTIWKIKQKIDGGRKVRTETLILRIKNLLHQGKSQRAIMSTVGCGYKLIKKAQQTP